VSRIVEEDGREDGRDGPRRKEMDGEDGEIGRWIVETMTTFDNVMDEKGGGDRVGDKSRMNLYDLQCLIWQARKTYLIQFMYINS
jgi:hypothetical protein